MKANREMRLRRMQEMNPRMAEMFSHRQELWREWKQYLQEHKESGSATDEEIAEAEKDSSETSK